MREIILLPASFSARWRLRRDRRRLRKNGSPPPSRSTPTRFASLSFGERAHRQTPEESPCSMRRRLLDKSRFKESVIVSSENENILVQVGADVELADDVVHRNRATCVGSDEVVRLRSALRPSAESDGLRSSVFLWPGDPGQRSPNPATSAVRRRLSRVERVCKRWTRQATQTLPPSRQSTRLQPVLFPVRNQNHRRPQFVYSSWNPRSGRGPMPSMAGWA